MFVKSWWVNTHHTGVVAEVENPCLPVLPQNGLSMKEHKTMLAMGGLCLWHGSYLHDHQALFCFWFSHFLGGPAPSES
jgi:hypothetical protein